MGKELDLVGQVRQEAFVLLSILNAAISCQSCPQNTKEKYLICNYFYNAIVYRNK